MRIDRLSLLAPLLLVACDKGDDSADESDADTDTDSDTDTDTATDTDTDTDTTEDLWWDGDTIHWYAQFAYDAKKGRVVESGNSNPVIGVQIFNWVGFQKSLGLTKPECSWSWDTESPPAATDMDPGFWITADMSAEELVLSDDPAARCDYLRGFMGVPRDDMGVEEFLQTFQWRFGVMPFANADEDLVEDFADIWDDSFDDDGDWKERSPYMAAGGYANTWTETAVEGGYAMGTIVTAWQVDEAFEEMEKDGDPVPLLLEGLKAAPSGYYRAEHVLYLYGTGF